MRFLILFLLLPCVAWGMWNKAMENPKLYGGDMVMTPEEYEQTVNGTNGYGSIVGGRWPGGKVPYIIDRSIGQQGRNAIQAAISDYHKYTCLRWEPRTNEQIYARFFFGQGCSSPVGYNQRVNDISLGNGCQDKGTAIHEMGHTIGLYHEQNRPDRDNYIQINRNAVQSGMYYNFQIENNIDSLGTPYDLRSIMHYSSTAFSRGPYYTIQTLDQSQQYLINRLDNGNSFSDIDIQQINLMYGCQVQVKPTDPPTGGCVNTDKDCDGWAAQGYCDSNEFLPFMKLKCCKACGGNFNPPPPSSCKDKFDKCNTWAKAGYCTAIDVGDKATMERDCCHSCKQSYAVCGNYDKYCDAWATQTPNECTVNPDWMLPKCPKACGICN